MNKINSQYKNPAAKENDIFESIERNEEKILRLKKNDQIDLVYGFDLHAAMKQRTGWLINMKTTDVINEDKKLISAMVYYFIEEDGSRFKSTLIFQPYFYIVTKTGFENEIQRYLMKKYTESLYNIEIIEKEDLDLDNHLTGLKKTFLKLIFHTIDDLVRIRKEIMPKIKQNKKTLLNDNEYSKMLAEHIQGEKKYDNNEKKSALEIMDNAIDIREYDVPYHVRVSIDTAIFIGKWYDVHGSANFKGLNGTHITPRSDIVDHPEPVVLAYDIETTKLPLKFPDSSFDQIMMISYMIDGIGFLICNREIIAEDIEDFEFTPRPEFPGPFTVFNEPNEKRTIERFFDHIREVKPNIFVSYNGDFFDWPFVETRAAKNGLDMLDYVGFSKDSQDEYKSRSAIHMDCFKWVQRDSYLPIGARGLKAVCKAKLGYNPVEVDPEEMCKFAREDPRTLANYSVSDAVATYYLYMKYVHPFIFALCTIIPMDPDEVLRKGSGTLCECLLMVEAFNSNIIFPNKQESKLNALTSDGHVIESETYVGGHVEAIESGVFRSDIPTKFKIVPEMCKFLRNNLKETLIHVLEVEEKVQVDSVLNFDEVYDAIDEKLQNLEAENNRFECPVIYHLDVAAMYPNIILSNRLQPSALVNEKTCAACDFNVPDAKCKRPMTWTWRGEIMPATKSEYYLIQSQLEKEKFPPKKPGMPMRSFYELTKTEQADAEKDRLGKYCRNAYNRKHNTRLEERTAVVCQRENAFYVDTVRAFRDRRYQYKDLTKVSKKRLDELISSGEGDATEIKRANGMLVLYDSLQLAHKCILNSFYGYVMRRGARWYSMEMAGIVCSTGAAIIKYAREMIEQVGRPLELDTDGIWCILPASFPQFFEFQMNYNTKGKQNISFSYPGAMLNLMVQQYFTNDQYHDLIDPVKHIYRIRSENSIFFEVDGPYLAMILPASKEMNKKLKKRYAVFNRDRSLAELKGFEVKRNGELNLIKIFQSSVFEAFLKGSSIEEVYQHVATVADYWLDLLYTKASTMPDEELFELISEKRCMSKKLEEYGKQKSTPISTARRLAEFLGDEMVKDAGLSFKFIISKKPEGAQITDRAIPVAIFQAEESVKRFYLSKWLKSRELQDYDIRNILDWSYYINRFSSNVQKIITIPAALQEVKNPVPRIPHPDWLHKILMEKDNKFKQQRITDLFQKITPSQAEASKLKDIEDCAPISKKKSTGVALKRARNSLVDVNGIQLDMDNLPNHWRDVLGDPVAKGKTKSELVLWLEFHKKKWIIQKILKDQSTLNKENIGPINVKRMKVVAKKGKQSGISSFFSRSKQSFLDDTWQIIEITETSDPGIYRVWTLIGQELRSMKLTVPRTFYVNSIIPKETGDNFYYKPVHKLLPRSHAIHNLYEYNIDEAIFIQHRSDILSELLNNEIEGIYELEVPLLLRVYVKLGCMCSIDRNKFTGQQNNDSSFQLEDLKFRSTAQHPYLSSDSIKTTFLFQQKSGKNEIIGWFDPDHNRAHVCLVEQTKSNNDKLKANIQSWYSREREASQSAKEKEKESCLPPLPEQVQFEISSHQFEISALKRINKLLVAYKNEVKTATILVTKTKMTINELHENISAINEFPLVSIAIDGSDSASLNVLDWQRIAVKSAVKVFVKYRELFAELLERSRYLHVPVGNMSKFTNNYRGISDSYDLFYARFLMKNDFVWWCSDKSEPDFGRNDKKDRRMLLVDNDGCSGLIYRNKPGCYPSSCVQLEMTYFPINTIIAMHKVMEIDGSNERIFESMIVPTKTIDQSMLQSQSSASKRVVNLTTYDTMYDDVAAAGPAFRILRNVILHWLDDVRNYKNPIADEHLMGFYKWMKCPRSLFYDPALYKSLQKLMRMVFFKLIEQLNNLGLEVVYGTLNKIVVCTKRTDLMDALVHVEYAAKTVKNQQDIFGLLDFQYVCGWDYLIWQDASNYSGVKADLGQLATRQHKQELSFVNLSEVTAAASQSQSDSFLTTEIADSDRIEINWHLSRYLSPMSGIQLRLIEVLQYFMLSNWKIVKDEYRLNQLAAQNDIAEEEGRNNNNSGAILKGADSSLYPSSVHRMEEFLQNEMGYKLYLMISQLKDIPRMRNIVTLATADDDDKTPPLLPLKDKVSKTPLVDLIRTICHILAIDTSARYYVDDWKRNMFKLINVNVYSDAGKWRSPYSSDESPGDAYKSDLIVSMSEMICDNCNATRDLDLCRDLYQARIGNSWWFVCPSCDFPYDRNVIHESLVDQVRSLCESNIMQDLKCPKCGILETSLAGAQNCLKCGNAIQFTQSATALKEKVKIYATIGKYYDLPYLRMITDWMLQGEDY